MQHIEFLPDRYREQNARRKVQMWRCTVLALFIAGIGATAVAQQTFRSAARRQLLAIDTQHAVARAKSEQFSLLQKQLKEVQATTQLYAYLRHPWPRTQILAGVAGKLTPALTLSDLRISREAAPAEATDSRKARRNRVRETTDEEAQAKLLPAARDLKRLREEHDGGITVVEVSGLTQDIAELHAFVARLSDVPLFGKCELASLEAVAGGKAPERGESLSRFRVRLVLRPGYGQPGSPTPPSPGQTPPDDTANSVATHEAGERP